ncbi:MAG: helix-turn-helix domain-containing protein [Candidatus Acidiferrales bacterium]
MTKAKAIAKTVRGTVFEQIGFSAEDSVALKMRAALHSRIVEVIQERGYTQAQLADLLDTDQPRISNLMRGKIADFNLETLVIYAEALGLSPQMRTARRPAEVAEIR